MPALLAECTACGRPFPAGEIGDGGFTLGPAGSSVHIGSMTISGGQVALEGTEVSCPRCGGMGHVPDGVYNILQEGAAVFRRLSSAETKRIVELLVRLEREERPPSPEDVDTVLQTVSAEARGFVAPLLKGTKWKYWLPILIAIAAIIVQHRDTNRAIDEAHRDAQEQVQQARAEAEATEDQLHSEISRVVEAIVANAGSAEPPPPRTGATTNQRKPGRNEPCFCGSGRKFKYCHGSG